MWLGREKAKHELERPLTPKYSRKARSLSEASPCNMWARAIQQQRRDTGWHKMTLASFRNNPSFFLDLLKEEIVIIHGRWAIHLKWIMSSDADTNMAAERYGNHSKGGGLQELGRHREASKPQGGSDYLVLGNYYCHVDGEDLCCLIF